MADRPLDESFYFPFTEYEHSNLTWESWEALLRYHYNGTGGGLQRDIDQDCHPFGGVFEVVHVYYLPFMIFVGLLGNILSCVVFLNTHLKLRSSSYYLAALACADFGFLTSLFLVWLSSTLEVPVFNMDGYCQCIVYVSSVCGFLSVWLIVAFTVERFIAVQYPLHRPHMCTVARAKAIVLYLVTFALVAHTYVFVTSGMIKLSDGSQVCEMLEAHYETMRIINIVDSLVTLIVPLILIIVMNTMITVNLFRFSRRFKKPVAESESSSRDRAEINLQASKSSSNNNNNNNSGTRRNHSQQSFQNPSQSFHSSRSNNSFKHVQPTCYRSPLPTNHRHTSEAASSRCGNITSSDRNLISTRTQHGITKMLLVVSTAFVILNLPSYIIRLYAFIFYSIWSDPPPVLLWCLQQMFMIFYYTNFSINFLFYSMCGITFRRCLWQLVRKKLKRISRYRCTSQYQ